MSKKHQFALFNTDTIKDVFFYCAVEKINLLCDYRNGLSQGSWLISLERLSINFNTARISVDIIVALY